MDSTDQPKIKRCPYYDRRQWRDRLQPFILRRDPVCMICNRTPSTIADHIKPHRCNFTLFFDDKNLQGVCKTCHDIKTATEDGGFGNPRLVGPRPEVSRAVATGERGKQFQASSVRAETVAKALAYDKDELLKGIPE